MCGTAAAASAVLTVMRTSSEPAARQRRAPAATVASMSAVSVLVIDCTTIGAVTTDSADLTGDGCVARLSTYVVAAGCRGHRPAGCAEHGAIGSGGRRKRSGGAPGAAIMLISR